LKEPSKQQPTKVPGNVAVEVEMVDNPEWLAEEI
jgi:hypothetical protein